MLDEIAFEELRRRDVDRDTGPVPTLRAPRCDRRGSRAQHPIREVVDEAGFLGDMDELRGRGDPPVGLAPAQQRLQPAHLERVERDVRLEHEQQVAGLDGAAQRLLHPEALRGRIVERRTVQGEAVASQLLGPKQCDVRRLEQAFGVRGVIRVEARADARARGQHAPVDRQRLLQRRDDLRRPALHVLDGFHVLDQHGEFVAA